LLCRLNRNLVNFIFIDIQKNRFYKLLVNDLLILFKI